MPRLLWEITLMRSREDAFVPIKSRRDFPSGAQWVLLVVLISHAPLARP